MDMVEYTYGSGGIMKLAMKALQLVRDGGGVLFLVVKSGSKLKK